MLKSSKYGGRCSPLPRLVPQSRWLSGSSAPCASLRFSLLPPRADPSPSLPCSRRTCACPSAWCGPRHRQSINGIDAYIKLQSDPKYSTREFEHDSKELHADGGRIHLVYVSASHHNIGMCFGNKGARDFSYTDVRAPIPPCAKWRKPGDHLNVDDDHNII